MSDKPVTPKQIGEVVGVDRMDALDRQKLDPRVKLQLLAAETKSLFSRDPRSGGFAIVARPRIIIQLLLDMCVGPLSSDIRLHKPVVIGVKDADVVGWWMDIPIKVRCTVIDDKLYCLPLEKIPESITPDRQTAGQLRINAHHGTLLRLRED